MNNERYKAYPWLTAPVRGKTFRCPDDHRAAMRAFVADCHKYLIIGTSGLDDDLLNEIASVIDGSKKHLVHYVDMNGTPARERFEKAVPVFVEGANGGSLVRTSDYGFSMFLNTNEIEDFLAAD